MLCFWSGCGYCFHRDEGSQWGATRKLGVDADFASLTGVVAELDIAIDQGEQSVVAANANVIAGFDLCAALANNDATGGNYLSIIAFHSKHFGVTVPTIAGTTHTFFMCHGLLFLCLAFTILDIFDPACATTACRLLLTSLQASLHPCSWELRQWPGSCHWQRYRRWSGP